MLCSGASALELSAHVWVTDSLKAQTDTLPPKRGVVSAGMGYGNNSSFFGRIQMLKYPYLSADVTLKSKRGLWFSALSYQIIGISGTVDETDLAAGWDVNVSERVDASLSYSRFFFGANNPLIKSGTNNAVTAYSGIDLGHVYTRLSGCYIFGSVHDVFLILDNSRYFEKKNVLHKKGYLSFEPRISVIAGTQSFAQTHIIREQSGLLYPIPTAPVPTPPSPTTPTNGPRPTPNRPTSPTTGGTTGNIPAGSTPSIGVTTVTTEFAVLTYEVKVPVAYSIGKFSLEGSWRYAVPVNLLEGDNSKPQSFWTTSLYYTFFLPDAKKNTKAHTKK